MLELFSNNASSTLAGAISNTALTATLSPGTGALFPSPAAGQFFRMTFQDAATTLTNEIVFVTARVGDVITIQRGREGTVGQNWLAGDLASNLWTAGSAGSMLQAGQQQAGAHVFGNDIGSANTVQVNYAPTITALTDGMVLGFRVLANNTGATTFSPNGIAAAPIYNAADTPLVAGQLTAGYNYFVAYDASASRWYLTAQSVGKYVGPASATETASGLLPVATQVDTDAGTNDAKAVSPLKLRFGFAADFTSQTGYIKFPSWLGGLLLQWGTQASAVSTTTTVTFPLGFPNICFQTLVSGLNVSGNTQAYVTLNTYSQGGAQVNCFIAPGGSAPVLGSVANAISIRWFAIGR